MSCLFCDGLENNYKSAKGVDYICSSCVLLLADANQNDLTRAYVKADAKGIKNKASALKYFIIEDEINETKTKKSKRDMVRERSLRKVRPSRYKIRA
jgi:hypothetical protein